MQLSRENFASNLNTRFWLRNGGPEREAVDLVEVTQGQSTPRQEQFSLTFRGDSAKVFPQRLYSMEHDTMGAFDLFLVPVGRDDTGTFYEAVFNRLRKDQN
jgi:uncharacterized protein DUF6916